MRNNDEIAKIEVFFARHKIRPHRAETKPMSIMNNLKFYRRFYERLILQLLVVYAIIGTVMIVLL
jgi:hypothetical protein